MAEPDKPRDHANAIGCVAMIVLWIALLLHFFADRIWDEEPAVLRWIILGYGCLFLLGLILNIALGKRRERIDNLVVLALISIVIALFVFWGHGQDDAAVDVLVRDLDEKGAEIERRAKSLPALPEKPGKGDLANETARVSEELDLIVTSSTDLRQRAENLLKEANASQRQKLGQALALFHERIDWARQEYNERTNKLRGMVKLTINQ